MFETLGYVLIALIALNTLLLIGMVGKPREPLSGGVAAAGTAVQVFFAWVIYGLIQGW